VSSAVPRHYVGGAAAPPAGARDARWSRCGRREVPDVRK
jgi:hypothetical protein